MVTCRHSLRMVWLVQRSHVLKSAGTKPSRLRSCALISGFPWEVSKFDELVRFREDDFSLQFSSVGDDRLFLRFDKGARGSEVWISDLNFQPEELAQMLRAFDVAAAEFKTTIAEKVVRMTSIAPNSADHDQVVEAFDRQRGKLITVVAALGRRYDDCYLDTSRPGKFDLVMKVL